MIRKTILTTALLLLLYSVFIAAFRNQIQRTAQTVEQRNTVKAEELLYENGQFTDSIIVGSSMSNRLIFDSLPGHYYNLALEGMSAAEGLWLIAQSHHRPRLLLIETNTLDHPIKRDFFSDLVASNGSYIRAHIPFMRLKYQPVGVLKALLRDWTDSTRERVVEPTDTAFVQKLVQERLDGTNDIPDDEALQKTIDEANVYVQAFRREGTRVLFFEMPTDERIRNSNVSRRLRELVRITFPESTYQYIQFPTEFYQTTDGVHLPRAECVRYTQYLCQQLNQNRVSATVDQNKATKY